MTLELSVVLAVAADHQSLEPALSAIIAACEGLSVEVIIVSSGSARLPRSGGPELQVIPVEPADLVPDRWGRGVEVSRAPFVAFTSSEFVVGPMWARKLLNAMSEDVVGVAGTIGLTAGSGMVDKAMYLLRFSAFTPGLGGSARVVMDIPGDNAIYRREDIRRQADLLRRGFWEVEFHRRFREEGRRLLLLPDQVAEFAGSARLVVRMQQRFRHGRKFGASRVQNWGEPWWRILIASPVVPLVMLLRILRRVGRTWSGLGLMVRSAPALMLLTGAWATGEAAGALRARRQTPQS